MTVLGYARDAVVLGCTPLAILCLLAQVRAPGWRDTHDAWHQTALTAWGTLVLSLESVRAVAGDSLGFAALRFLAFLALPFLLHARRHLALDLATPRGEAATTPGGPLITPPKLPARLLAILGGVALVLAAIGPGLPSPWPRIAEAALTVLALAGIAPVNRAIRASNVQSHAAGAASIEGDAPR